MPQKPAILQAVILQQMWTLTLNLGKMWWTYIKMDRLMDEGAKHCLLPIFLSQGDGTNAVE